MSEIPESFRTEALELLREYTGDLRAEFHADQLESIYKVVEGRERLLLVQRTGWGKSAVYFIATKLLRSRGSGPTLLVSPLLALMRDQVRGAQAILAAEMYNSENEHKWPQIELDLVQGEIDILLITPERLANEDFINDVLPLVTEKSGLLVIDEAHCISTWGHDFRPDYRRLKNVVEILPRGVPVLACTATANTQVVDDVTEIVGIDSISRGPLRRDGLELQAARLGNAERLVWLSTNLPTFEGSGIVYVLTKDDADKVALWLKEQGISAEAYHSDVDALHRPEVEKRLLDEEIKVVVATPALGMGFDHPRLSFVIHYQTPQSVIHYYQQVGRAGRKLENSFGVLFKGSEDEEINQYFIETSFPDEEKIRELIRFFEDAGGWVQRKDVLSAVNARLGAIKKMLTHLVVQGAIEKIGGKYRRTLNSWDFDSEIVREITNRKQVELSKMKEYVNESGCLNLFLLKALDDPYVSECGICQNCSGEYLDLSLDESKVDEAAQFLKKDYGIISPRLRSIPQDERNEPGRYLSLWGRGLGKQVKEVKDNPLVGFGDELVLASQELIENDWNPEPSPTWIAVVPSKSLSSQLEHFAIRLAENLGIPFVKDGITQKPGNYQPQKTMQNQFFQKKNVENRFVVSGNVPRGPVLLVDDVVDSKWTFTVIGTQLRRCGVEAVYPFALADSSGGG